MTATPLPWPVHGTTPPASPRWWVEIEDPTGLAQRFRCDATWLTSRWTCLFDAGCPGIEHGRPDDGCCTFGAHLTDHDDLARVRAAAARLGDDEWELRTDDWWETDEEGDRVTRVVDGACVFLNRPGFPAGAGCALHQHALAEGVEPWTLKPDVCWQLPVKRSYRTVTREDGTEYLEVTLGEFDRAGWGPGGADLAWWCTGAPEAHVGAEPVYVALAAELTELMGAQAYAALVAALGDGTESCDAADGRITRSAP